MANPTVYEPGAVEPGWTTTEFYQTLLVQVVAAVVALVTLFRSGFNLSGLQAIIPTIAVAAAAIAQAIYSISRSRTKSAASAAAVAAVTSANATASAAAMPEALGMPGAKDAAAPGDSEPALIVMFRNMGVPVNQPIVIPDQAPTAGAVADRAGG